MRPPLPADDPTDLTLAHLEPCGYRQDAEPVSVESPYLTNVVLGNLVRGAVAFTSTVNHVLSIVRVRSEYQVIGVDADGVVTGVTHHHSLRNGALVMFVGHHVPIDHLGEQVCAIAQAAIAHRSTLCTLPLVATIL